MTDSDKARIANEKISTTDAKANHSSPELRFDDAPPSVDSEPASKAIDEEKNLAVGALQGPVTTDGPELSALHAFGLAATTMTAYWMMTVQTGSIMILVPVIAKAYDTTPLRAQWVNAAFALTQRKWTRKCKSSDSRRGLLVSGRLADLYGRKQLFIGGLGICLVASIVSAVIPRFIPLCIARGVAGLGLAIVAPSAFGIVGTCFRTEPRRTYAFAALGVGSPMGGAVGEVLGGVIAGSSGRNWRYLFYICAGFSLIPMISGYILIPPEPARSVTGNRRLDWIGAILITVAMTLLSFSLTQSGTDRRGWKAPYVPSLLVVSIILVIVFGFWEAYVERRTAIPPIVKLERFTRHHWRVTMVLLTTFLLWCGICGWIYLSGIYFQTLERVSPLQSALRVLPGCIFGAGICYFITLLAPRVSAPILLTVGSVSTGLASCLMAVQPFRTLCWKVSFFAALCHPAGGDITIPIGSILISNLVNPDEQSVSGALFQVSLQLASALDTCISSLIHTQLEGHIGLLDGVRAAYWFNAAACWTALPLVWVSLWRVGLAKDVAKVL